MNFIAPEFLYALSFLAIPIIIHLFNFRRYKTVKFSQVRFLKDVKKQTQSTSRLKHLIVLLLRCIALTALVVAFAQPYLNEDENLPVKGRNGVIIYLDNSFSMQANAEAGSLLDVAKSKIIEIVDAYAETDRFQLHTNEFEGNQMRWLNKSAFINSLMQTNYSPIFRSYGHVLSRINQQNNEEDYSIKKYLVSDLQKSNFNFNSINDSTTITFIPVQSESESNVWVSSLNSLQPFHLSGLNEQLDLVAKRSLNKEESSYNGSLILNGKLKSPFTIKLENDSTAKALKYINPEEEAIKGELIIKDYPVTFDDTFFFSYPMQQQINILHIYNNEADNSIKALYKGDSLVNYYSSSVQQVDFSLLKNSSLIILDELISISSGLNSELVSFVNNGGSLVLFPSTKMNRNEINALLRQLNIPGYGILAKDSADVTQINGNAAIFKNVFEELPKQLNLPRAFSYWNLSSAQNTLTEPILTFRNGNDFLKKYTINSGAVYLSAVGLNDEQSNFSNHALFVPILFNMALQSVNPQELAYTLGEESIVIKQITQKESPLVLKRGKQELIPKQVYRNNSVEIVLGNELTEAGHYQLYQGDEFLQTISFNFSRKESDLIKYNPGSFLDEAKLIGLDVSIIEGEAEFLGELIKSEKSGKKLWKYFIALSLLFIALEILFLRILKG